MVKRPIARDVLASGPSIAVLANALPDVRELVELSREAEQAGWAACG